MPSIKSLFGTDKAAAVEGVWMDFGPIRVRVARADKETNPNYRRAMDKLSRPIRRQIQLGAVAAGDEAYNKLVREAFAEAVITAWEGVTEEDGVTEMPCTRENVLRMFEESPDFFRRVDDFATSREPYRVLDQEADAKNS
jgi:hypothetical protein